MKKVMKLIDERTGLMECKVCGERHLSSVRTGGYFKKGSWHCRNGCEIEKKSNITINNKKRRSK
jgi:hypothetical protein